MANRPDPAAPVVIEPVEPEPAPVEPSALLVPLSPPPSPWPGPHLFQQLMQGDERGTFLGAAAALAAIPSEEDAMIVGNCVRTLLEHTSGASASSHEPLRNVREGDWAFLQLPRGGNNWLAMQRRAQAHPNPQLYMFPEAARAWDVHFISIAECFAML